MLIVKVFANQKQIDEIQIQNISKVEADWQSYAIRKPEEKENHLILHKKSTGYKPLLKSVLDILIKKELGLNPRKVKKDDNE
jgi:hypothetical protein